MKGLPTTWDVKTGKNVKWVAELGSQSYGNPVVAGGVVLVGTNNEAMRDSEAGRRSRRADGVSRSDRRVPVAGDVREAVVGPRQRLAVPGHRLVAAGRSTASPTSSSNRGQVIAVDLDGFHDKTNDGPVKDEKLTGTTDPDFIWMFDMMEEVGSFPHNLANSSPVSLRESDLRRARRTARTRATSTSRRRRRRRSSRSTGRPASWCGKTTRSRIASCTASGRRRRSARSAASCRSCTRRATAGCAATRRVSGKKLWEFDTNPKDSVWPKTRNEVISTPVIVENVVYIANGQDPEHGEGVGHAYAIDATKRGDITTTGGSGTTTRSAARSRRRRSRTA